MTVLLERKKKLDESIKDILKPAKRAKKRSKKNEDDVRGLTNIRQMITYRQSA